MYQASFSLITGTGSVLIGGGEFRDRAKLNAMAEFIADREGALIWVKTRQVSFTQKPSTAR